MTSTARPQGQACTAPIPEEMQIRVRRLCLRLGRNHTQKALGVNEMTLHELTDWGRLKKTTIARIDAMLAAMGEL